MSDRLTTIAQHWAHYLERDIPTDAPDVQVMAMKQAFAAGAISGMQLTLHCSQQQSNDKALDDLQTLVSDIKQLAGQ